MIISHVENVSLLSNTTCMYVCIDLFSVCIFSFFVFPVTIVFGLRYCHFTIFHFLFLFLSFRSSRIDDCTLFVLWIMELVVAVIFSIYITIGKSEQNLYSCINMENKSIKQKSKREQSQNEAFRKWYKYLSGLYVCVFIINFHSEKRTKTAYDRTLTYARERSHNTEIIIIITVIIVVGLWNGR